MHLFLVGLNYKTAPVEVREALAIPAGESGRFAKQLVAAARLREAVVLSTCNRTEVYAAADDADALSRIAAVLANTAGRSAFAGNTLYTATDAHVANHLYGVAAGLDSLVVGEPQILGQVRNAYAEAHAAGTTGLYMGQLLRSAVEVGKRIRTETNVGAGAASISYAAVELARKIFGALDGKTALLVGAGEMAELAARNLKAHGVGRVHVANRTFARAETLAAEFAGEAHSLDALGTLLGKVDICITSTGAPEPIVHPDMVRRQLRERRGKPLFIIDIAVPRNVDPAVHRLDGVFVYNIDDLQAVVESNLALRRGEALEAAKIVAAETARFSRWLREQEAVPLVVELRSRAQQQVAVELERVTRRRPQMSAEDKATVQAALESLANKLLHAQIVGLRTAAGQDAAALESAARLLGLSLPQNSHAHSSATGTAGGSQGRRD